VGNPISLLPGSFLSQVLWHSVSPITGFSPPSPWRPISGWFPSTLHLHKECLRGARYWEGSKVTSGKLTILCDFTQRPLRNWNLFKFTICNETKQTNGQYQMHDLPQTFKATRYVFFNIMPPLETCCQKHMEDWVKYAWLELAADVIF